MKSFSSSTYSDSDLIHIYSELLQEMKARNIIRSKNVTGDLGEFIAIDYYRNTKGLPKLQFAPPSTKNIDAISVNGDRYSIKTTTTHTTGAFYGIEKNANLNSTKQAFEYLILVKLDDNFSTELILEIDWPTFFKYKHWHSRINAYNIIISNELIKESKIIYQASQEP